MNSNRSTKILDILGYVLSFVVLCLACMGLKSSSETAKEIEKKSINTISTIKPIIESKKEELVAKVNEQNSWVDIATSKFKEVKNSISVDSAEEVLDSVSDNLNSYIGSIENNNLNKRIDIKDLKTEKKPTEDQDGLSGL